MTTLKERLEEVMQEHGLKTQQQLAEFAGVSKGLVGQWFKGDTGLGAKPLLAFETKTNFSTRWLVEGKGDKYRNEPNHSASNVGKQGELVVWNRFSDLPKDEWALIPYYRDTQVSAGNGVAHSPDHNHFKLPFSKAALKRLNIDPQHAVCLSVTGNSMFPLLPDGTTVGIHTADTQIRDGKIYALKYNGLLRVKVLHGISDSEIRVQSANPDKTAFPDEMLNVADVEIVGRVFWWSVLD